VCDKKLEFLKVFFAFLCNLSPSRSSLDEADLEKVGFHDIFDGGNFFSDDGGKSRESNRFFIKCFDEVSEEFSIEDIETIGIDPKSIKYRFTVYLCIDLATDRRIVTNNFYIPIGDSRCPASSLGN
jgi:hypothetical protein